MPIGRRARLFALSCLCLFVVISGASLAARRQKPPSAATLRGRLQSIRGRKSQVIEKLRAAKQAERQVTRRLNEIDARLDATEARLHQVKVGVSVARANLQTATVELRHANQNFEDRRDLVAERLVAVYQEGDVKPLEVILQSTSFSDFANRVYLVDQVVSRDAEILDDLGTAQDRADQRKRAVQEQKEALAARQQQEELVKAQTMDVRQDTAQEKAQVLRSRAAAESELAVLQANSNQISAMLRRLQSRRGSRGRGGTIVTPWRGSLLRPLNGQITSGFGYRIHPILGTRRMHTGVDIRCSSGTPVHAAAGGEVAFAGRLGGYGNCVILNHGGGLATVYGHCSSLIVSEGQTIRQGQVIAYSGSTGFSTGPHLHFEVRRNGTPVSPFGI